MKLSSKIGIGIIAALAVVFISIIILQSNAIALFNPHGIIAEKEKGLIILSVLLMLVIIVPVYALTFFVAWHYRASNTKAVYLPDWQHSKMDELVWWAIPFEIVLILGALTWSSTHELDPYQAITSSTTPITIEVVALPWKWLFIYPEQHVASVNVMQFPVNTPLNLKISADAPMNSFWIPELGGQIYAMTGMVTPLHLMANKEGEFAGSSSNYSGVGFAHMKFIAKATSKEEFDVWVLSAQQSPELTADAYSQLARPSETASVQYFSLFDSNFFNTIVMKFNDMAGQQH